MNRKSWLLTAVLLIVMVLCFSGCGGQDNNKDADDAVIADGLAKIKVDGQTDLPGISFFRLFTAGILSCSTAKVI